MKWREWLENWSLTSLKIKLYFLDAEWSPRDADRDAAWELYIELLTRITTQPLEREHGVEATALASVHALFGLTREVIKRHGRQCQEFTKLAIVVLNQVVRPFTAKWHRLSQQGAFERRRPLCGISDGTRGAASQAAGIHAHAGRPGRGRRPDQPRSDGSSRSDRRQGAMSRKIVQSTPLQLFLLAHPKSGSAGLLAQELMRRFVEPPASGGLRLPVWFTPDRGDGLPPAWGGEDGINLDAAAHTLVVVLADAGWPGG